MAVRQILPQDTLESGFRIKYNETIGLIIINASVLPDGTLILYTANGDQLEVFLTDVYFTKQQVLNALDSGANVPLATEEAPGIIRIATEEEVAQRLSDNAAVTPAKLDNLLNFRITKSGADINSNGDIDLSDEENIPDWKTPSVWVNDISGSYQTQYNRVTKIISGLYGVQPGDTITIVF